MIGKSEFEELIKALQEYDAELNEWDRLGVDMFETRISTAHYKIESLLMKTLFDENGEDWINWYLYEKNVNPSELFDDWTETDIPPETISELWMIVKNHLK
jgi:hypothetical protein